VRAPPVESRQLEGVVVHVLAVFAADEVPAVDVVDVAVVVVVAAVAGHFLRIRPEIRVQIDVRGVDATVDEGDEHGARWLLAGEELTSRTLGADAGNTVGRCVEELPVLLCFTWLRRRSDG